MRIDQLSIPAFGPFSDFSLELSRSESDLHLIYGANEQGKSSLLRAIDNLLFGIPLRSADDFLHPKAKLRIAATLSSGESEALSIIRKTGRKSLLDPEQNSLDESELTRLLGPVDRSFFASMFGLDTELLRSGAQSLIDGEGDLGTTLFSASLGNTSIDDAIKSFEEEAGSLFKKTGRKGIREKITAHAKAEKESRAETLTANAWKTHRKDLSRAEEDFSSADKHFHTAGNSLRRIEKSLSALPTINRLKRDQSRLADGPPLPDLSADFTARVRAAQADLQAGQKDHTRLKNQLTEEKSRLADITVDSDILAHSGEIEALYQVANSYAERCTLLPSLDAQVKSGEHTLQNSLERISLSAEKLATLPSVSNELLTEEARLNKALHEHELRQTLATGELTRLTEEQKSLAAQLDELPEVSQPAVLESLARRNSAARTESAQLLDKQNTLAEITTELRELSVALGLNDCSVLASLAVPDSSIISEEKLTWQNLQDAQENACRSNRELKSELLEEEQTLEELRKHLPLTSRAELLHARSSRDQLISEILYSPEKLPVLKDEIHHSDRLADSLHDDADQIAKASQSENRVSRIAARLKLANSEERSADTAFQNRRDLWLQRLESANLPPLPPAEFLIWEQHSQNARDLLRKRTASEKTIANISESLAQLIADLQTQLELNDNNLETLATALEQNLTTLNRASGNRSALEKQLAALSEKRAAAEARAAESDASIDSILAQLKKLTAPFPAALSEIQAAQMQLRDLSAATLERDRVKNQIFSISERIDALISILEPGADPKSFITQIWDKLVRTKESDTRAKLLQDSISKTNLDFTTAQHALDAANAALATFQKTLGAKDLAALEDTLPQIEGRLRLTSSITDLTDSLAELSEDGRVEDFIQDVTSRPESELLSSKRELELSLIDLQEKRDAAKARRDELLTTQRRYENAGDAAAARAQDAELILSDIVDDSRRFIRLQHAIQFLRKEIETFREASQGPMLIRTSEYFSKLTNGAFSGVAAQTTDKNTQILVGVRSDCSSVTTSAMSEGTADQLYLALRLAAIELHLASHPAMPLILDDLLMTFDDERASALIPILVDFSKKTQVLVFTHHQHLETLFTKKAAGSFTSHRL